MLLKYISLSLFSLSLFVRGSQEDVPAIGIDLGTTYSCVAVYRNGQVEVIANEQGNRITPSYVSFLGDDIIVGEGSKNQAHIHPENTIFDIKRIIGRRFSDSTVKEDIKKLPYKIITSNERLQIEMPGVEKKHYPEYISSLVLTKMKNIASTYLGRDVTEAVITVPAYFNDAQRKATKDAGQIAGLKVLRIVNEPTAAALAYGVNEDNTEKNILVFDLGGGTFDVSLLTIDDGVFQVLSTSGDTHLGGEDFDQNVVTHLLKLFKKKHGKDLSDNKVAVAKIRAAAEQAKRQLSSVTQTEIEIESIADGIDLVETLTRAKFEELNAHLFKKTMAPIDIVLSESRLSPSDIQEVVLVGGSTRIPKIQQMVKDKFNGKEPNKGVNPDEAVAYGAAVQAAIIKGHTNNKQNLVLLEVTPLSLGIETVGGVFATVIPKNSGIPISKKQTFTTAADNQEAVKISVYEGERPMVNLNHHLSDFDLKGIPPQPARIPQIDVTFSISVEGVLDVSASLASTGKTEKITIDHNKERLSQEEIDKMLREAEENAEADKAVRQGIEAKNSLDSYLNSLSSVIKQLSSKSDKESQDAVKTLESLIKKGKDALNDDDNSAEELNEIRKSIETEAAPIIGKLSPGAEGDDSDSDGEEL